MAVDEEEEIRCIKCKSLKIKTDHKGYGLGKAAAGGLLLGPIGLLGGMIGAKKVKLTCINCGYECSLAHYIEHKENEKAIEHLSPDEKKKHENFLAWAGVLFVVFIVVIYLLTNGQ